MLTFGLDYLTQPKFPQSPRALVFIDTVSRSVEGEKQYVTPECVTYPELEANVDKIIKVLERVKKDAAKRFEATKRDR